MAEWDEFLEGRGIGIVADSSCDLPRQWLERLRVDVVPLVVRFGSETYNDVDLTADESWEKSIGPEHPGTSQPSIGASEEVFARLLEQGKQVLCVTVTGEYSGTFNVARLAAQRFGEAARVLDSRAFSLGLGLQALVGAQLAQAGASMEEILDKLADIRDRTRIVLVLEALENLRRGGESAPAGCGGRADGESTQHQASDQPGRWRASSDGSGTLARAWNVASS